MGKKKEQWVAFTTRVTATTKKEFWDTIPPAYAAQHAMEKVCRMWIALPPVLRDEILMGHKSGSLAEVVEQAVKDALAAQSVVASAAKKTKK